MKGLLSMVIFLCIAHSITAQNCNWNVDIEVVSPVCPRESNGQAQVFINGSPATLQQADYLWSTGYDMPSVNGLKAGFYSVTISDKSNACSSVLSFQVIDPTFPIYHISSTPEQCGESGSVSITVPGSKSWYTKWQDGEVGIPNETNGEYLYTRTLNSGFHGFYLDVDGCNVSDIVQIGTVPPIQIIPSWADLSIDFSNEIITVTTQVTGGVAPYTYEWYWSQSPNKVFSQEPELNTTWSGSYFLKITDATGCREYSETIYIIDNSTPAPSIYGKDLYPNPGIDLINVPVEKGHNEISLFSSDGKLLHSAQYDSHFSVSHIPIDISAYSEGAYYFIISNNDLNSTESKKFVIKK